MLYLSPWLFIVGCLFLLSPCLLPSVRFFLSPSISLFHICSCLLSSTSFLLSMSFFCLLCAVLSFSFVFSFPSLYPSISCLSVWPIVSLSLSLASYLHVSFIFLPVCPLYLSVFLCISSVYPSLTVYIAPLSLLRWREPMAFCLKSQLYNIFYRSSFVVNIPSLCRIASTYTPLKMSPHPPSTHNLRFGGF